MCSCIFKYEKVNYTNFLINILVCFIFFLFEREYNPEKYNLN